MGKIGGDRYMENDKSKNSGKSTNSADSISSNNNPMKSTSAPTMPTIWKYTRDESSSKKDSSKDK